MTFTSGENFRAADLWDGRCSMSELKSARGLLEPRVMSIINSTHVRSTTNSLAAHSSSRINSDQRPTAASKLCSDLPQNLIEGRGLVPTLVHAFHPR